MRSVVSITHAFNRNKISWNAKDLTSAQFPQIRVRIARHNVLNQVQIVVLSPIFDIDNEIYTRTACAFNVDRPIFPAIHAQLNEYVHKHLILKIINCNSYVRTSNQTKNNCRFQDRAPWPPSRAQKYSYFAFIAINSGALPIGNIRLSMELKETQVGFANYPLRHMRLCVPMQHFTHKHSYSQ